MIRYFISSLIVLASFVRPANAQAGGHPLSVTASTDFVHTALLVLLGGVFVGSFFYYQKRLRNFEKIYADLQRKLPRITSDDGLALGASPGHSFALASRGPTYAFDAEFRSAEARWRHVMAAFPQLDVAVHQNREKVILVPAPYTNLPVVHEMQHFIENRIKDTFASRIFVPGGLKDLKEDFDVLKYPELAIANPCFYTLPFFLTWQRRHLWGVLPYATHSRLGVLVRPDHPKIDALRKIQSDYEGERDREAGLGLWVQDSSLARWLPILLEIAGDKPSKLDRTKPRFDDQHLTPTVFAVGSYLHQELLPLACAVLGSTEAAAIFADRAQRIEPSELLKLLPRNIEQPEVSSSRETGAGIPQASTEIKAAEPAWPKESAVIVDLALCNNVQANTGLVLLRLPHCVYVPIGIGYSVLAWPLLARTAEARKWTGQLLTYSANMLLRSKTELSEIGIELDQRLWQHLGDI